MNIFGSLDSFYFFLTSEQLISEENNYLSHPESDRRITNFRMNLEKLHIYNNNSIWSQPLSLLVMYMLTFCISL